MSKIFFDMILPLYDIIMFKSTSLSQPSRALRISLPFLSAFAMRLPCLHAAEADAGFKPITSRSVAVTRSPETPEYARPLGKAAEA